MPRKTYIQRLYLTLLLTLATTGLLRGASVADLEYINHGTYIEITDCNEAASGVLVIPETIEGLPVEEVKSYTFYHCHLITQIHVPSSVRLIRISPQYPSYNGLLLEAIVVDSANTTYHSVDGVLFNNTELLVYPSAKPETIFSVPEGVESIISHSMLAQQYLVRLNIPASVNSIDTIGLKSCLSLTTIHVDSSNQYFKDIDGILFQGNDLLLYPRGKSETTYTIPDGTLGIIDDFSRYIDTGIEPIDTIGLESIEIPASVTDIPTGRASPFFKFSLLSEINVDSLNTRYSSTDGVLFSKDGTKLLKYPMHRSATSYTIPLGVTIIDDYAFSGLGPMVNEYHTKPKLRTVVFSDSVTDIEFYAFYHNIGVETVLLSSSVQNISTAAFAYAFDIVSIDIDVSNPYFSSHNGALYTKDKSTLFYFPEIDVNNYDFPSELVTLGSYSFGTYSTQPYVVLPDQILRIERGAFVISDIITIKLPKNLQYLGDQVFQNCYFLKGLRIPSSVTEIGSDLAFYAEEIIFEGDLPILSERAFAFRVIYHYGGLGFPVSDWELFTPPNTTDEYIGVSLSSVIDGWVLSYGYDHNATNLSTDTNADGVPLLMEYALDLNPYLNNAANLPQPVRNGDMLELTYYAESQDISYSVETSTDLINWTTAGVTTIDTDIYGYSTASVYISDGVQHFMRLIVSD